MRLLARRQPHRQCVDGVLQIHRSAHFAGVVEQVERALHEHRCLQQAGVGVIFIDLVKRSVHGPIRLRKFGAHRAAALW